MSIHSEPQPDFEAVNSAILGYGTTNDHDPTLDDEGVAGQYEQAEHGLFIGPKEAPDA